MDFYSVKAMFGHVGRNNYVPKLVAVKAENGREAANYVRWMGRVKHNKKDAILSVTKISFEEYKSIKENMKNDPYFHVSSKQEQNKQCPSIKNEIVCIKTSLSEKNSKKRKEKVKYKLMRNKILICDAYFQIKNYEQVCA